MARLHVLTPAPRTAALWSAGRWTGLLGLAALVGTLFVAPAPALTTLWYVAVPLLPASFFVTPALWRGVCPLSTLNAWGNRLGGARDLAPREAALLAALGLALFHLLVPARHLGLNTSGPALAALLLLLAAIAVLAGAVYASRSAFCNALCPVLPVERLYGQAPLVDLTRGRCDLCTVCTPRGCLDLADHKALRQLLGTARRDHRWLTTPFGVFAAALPGFIVGYGLTPDLPATEWPRVYAATLGGSAASWVTVAALVRAARLDALRALALCAALSGILYYWFTAPLVTGALGLAPAVTAGLRLAAIAALTLWGVRTLSGAARPLSRGDRPE